MASREIGSVWIRVAPDASDFRRDAQRQINRQPDIEADADVVMDQSQYMREKRQAEREMGRRPIGVTAEVDIETQMRGQERYFKHMNDMTQSARDTRAEIERMSAVMERMSESIATMHMGIDEESYRRAMQRMQELGDRVEELELGIVASTGDAQRTMEAFRTGEEARSIDIGVEADLNAGSFVAARATAEALTPTLAMRVRLHMGSALGAMAQLQALGSRPRYVDFIPRIPAGAWMRMEAQLAAMSRRRVIRMAEGMFDRVWRTWAVGGFRSMAGLGDMDELLHTLDRLVSRLDVVSTQAAMAATAIGSIANVGVHALGGLIVTLADVSRALGLIAAAPSMILAAWAGMHTHRSIWQDFSDALEGNEDALERLPPNALRAVDAINHLSETVNRSIQDGFWDEMADEITRFAETVGPVLEQGMQRTAQIYGESLSDMLDMAQQWAESGQLGAAFSNINRMFEGVGGGITEIFDAFVTAGMRASRLMPRLGHEFENLGRAINNYTQWASEMGMLEYWIESGVNVATQLGRAGTAVVQMAEGLTQAFRNAGITGLPAFISGMERAAEVMQSPVWQFRMGNMFSGFRQGALEVWSGLQDINRELYEAHDWVRRISIATGEAGGEFLSRIADVIGNLTFQEGMIDLVVGFRDALDFLEVGADHFGDILGSLGTIGGEILRETAPGIETLLGIFSDAANALTPLIVSLIDPLTQFIDNLGHTVRHNVNNIIAPALGLLIEGFLRLPPLLQNIIALAMAMARWMPAFGQAATRAMGRLSDASLRATQSMIPLTDRQRQLRRGIQQQAAVIPGATGAMARLAEQYRRTGQLIEGTYRPMSRMQSRMQTLGRASATAQANANAGFRAVGANIASALVPIQRFDDGLRRANEGLDRLARTGEQRVTQFVGTRSGAAQMFAPLHQELGRVERRSRNVFRGMGAAIGAQMTAAGRAVQTALVPALTAGRVAAVGLYNVIRSMYALMGGLPGLLLIGAIAAIGHFRGQAAEARREVESLSRAMETGDTLELMDSISELDGMREALASIEKAGFDAGYVLGELALGNDMSEFATDIDNVARAYDQLETNSSRFQASSPLQEFVEGREVAPEFRDRIDEIDQSFQNLYGTSIQGIGMDAVRSMVGDSDGLRDAADSINHVQEQMAEAEAQATLFGIGLQTVARQAARSGDYRSLHEALIENGEGFAEASDAAQHFAQAVGRANEEGATVDSRIQGMSQALRTLRGDYQDFEGTGYEAWNRQEQAIRTATEAAEANGSITDDLIIGNGRLASSSEAYAVGQEKLQLAHQAVNETLEGQIALGMEAYDAAIANGDGHAEAVQKASTAFNDWEDNIDAVIDAMGLQGEAADAVRGEMEALAQYKDFEMVLTMSGLSEEEIGFAYDGLDRIRRTGQEIDGTEWAAFIAANPEQAYTVMYDAQRAFENMVGYNYVMELGGNADEAFGVIADAMGKGDEYDRGEYSAILHAIADGAEIDIDRAAKKLVQYSEMNPEATLLTQDEATEIIQGLIEHGGEWDNSTFTAHLEEEGVKTLEENLGDLVEALQNISDVWVLHLQSEGVDTTSLELDEVKDKGDGLDGETWSPTTLLEDAASGTLDKVRENLDEVGNTRAEAILDAYDNASDKTEFVKELVSDLDSSRAEAILEAYDDASDKTEFVKNLVDELGGTRAEATLEAYDNASDKVGFVKELAEEFDAEHAEAILDAYDNASDKTEFVKELIEGIDEMRAEAEIDANDEASPKASGALTTLGMIDGSWWANLFANDEVSDTADGAKSSVESVPSWWQSIFSGSDRTTGVAGGVMSAIGGVPTLWHSLFSGSDSTSGVAGGVGAAVRGVPSFWRSLFSGSDGTSGVAGAVGGAVRGVPTFWPSLFSGSDGTSGVAHTVGGSIAAVPGSKLSHFIGQDGTSGPAGAAQSAVEAIPGSRSTTLSVLSQVMYILLAKAAAAATQAIPTVWRTLLMLLGGGGYVSTAMAARTAIMSIPTIWRSRILVTSNAWAAASSARRAINSVRSRTVTIHTRRTSSGRNADGGMWPTVSPANTVRTFANGGLENHVAQISSPRTPYRIWAEPETGGEAYIPLAASKRARSTAIWRETGRRLGVYEDGGVVGGEREAASSGPTFNITNNYPQAEPTSRTVARSMEQLGAGGSGRW